MGPRVTEGRIRISPAKAAERCATDWDARRFVFEPATYMQRCACFSLPAGRELWRAHAAQFDNVDEQKLLPNQHLCVLSLLADCPVICARGGWYCTRGKLSSICNPTIITFKLSDFSLSQSLSYFQWIICAGGALIASVLLYLDTLKQCKFDAEAVIVLETQANTFFCSQR